MSRPENSVVNTAESCRPGSGLGHHLHYRFWFCFCFKTAMPFPRRRKQSSSEEPRSSASSLTPAHQHPWSLQRTLTRFQSPVLRVRKPSSRDSKTSTDSSQMTLMGHWDTTAWTIHLSRRGRGRDCAESKDSKCRGKHGHGCSHSGFL